GYSDTAVVSHYLKLVGAIGLIGVVLGGALGIYLGRVLASVYTDYYRFPLLVFDADPRVYVLVLGVTAAAVGGGAAFAVRRAATIEPAEAMMPAPPPDYSRALGARVTALRPVDQQTRMILRQIIRFPMRAGFTSAGVAVSGALLIGTLFFLDAMDEMIDVYFNVANRHDVEVRFVEPRSRSAYFELLRAPGVIASEPFRSVSARLRNGYLEERIGLTGLPLDATLTRMIDTSGRPVVPPPGGLVLSQDVAGHVWSPPGEAFHV